MQTRDYDDYVFVEASLGFRKVSDDGLTISTEEQTDGYCNIYSDSISVSYLHSMSESEINTIHYFEDNFDLIFKEILKHLEMRYINPKLELGFRHVNILNKTKNNFCFTEYSFIDAFGKKIIIEMHKNSVIY